VDDAEWEEPRAGLAPAIQDSGASRSPAAANRSRVRLAKNDPFDTILRGFQQLPRIAWIASAAALVIVAIASRALSPSERFVPISHIRANARQFDGRLVHLRGRVGQTFPVGGGYAFYLHDGADTMVVFTRLRAPVENDDIKLFGTVSTGYLDGVPRPAAFEVRPPAGH
jgi:hypothetical protein